MIIKSVKAVLLLACIIGMSYTGNSQNKSYEMYESITLIPDNTKLKTLSENMRKHNQKYHNKDAHQAYVYNIATGPDFGKIVWEMGPLTFSHLDSRPTENGHDEDWRDNVMPYIKKMVSREYWKKNEKISVDSNNPEKQPNYLYIRYFDVVKNEGHNVERLFEQVSATFKAMEGDNPWSMYNNLFRQGELGRHIATVTQFDKWGELDIDLKFEETFKRTHSESEWDVFLENMNDSFSNSWDEIWRYNAFMSGK